MDDTNHALGSGSRVSNGAVPFSLPLVGGTPGPSPCHFPANIHHYLEFHMGLFKTIDSTALARLPLMKYVDSLVGWFWGILLGISNYHILLGL